MASKSTFFKNWIPLRIWIRSKKILPKLSLIVTWYLYTPTFRFYFYFSHRPYSISLFFSLSWPSILCTGFHIFALWDIISCGTRIVKKIPIKSLIMDIQWYNVLPCIPATSIRIPTGSTQLHTACYRYTSQVIFEFFYRIVCPQYGHWINRLCLFCITILKTLSVK